MNAAFSSQQNRFSPEGIWLNAFCSVHGNQYDVIRVRNVGTGVEVADLHPAAKRNALELAAAVRKFCRDKIRSPCPRSPVSTTIAP